MPVQQNSLRFRLVGSLGALLVRAARATWRVEHLGRADVTNAVHRGEAQGIMAFWHRHILTMLARHPGARVAVPVSEHRDGEYVAQVMQRFGIASVRGSSTRGGLRLLRGMMAAIEQGYSPTITPDGPVGPKFSVQPGIWLLARRSGLPVYPLGVAVRDAWTAGSWDEFVIPKPFTRTVVWTGEPLRVREYADRQAFCAALRQAMFAATDSARRALRGLAPAQVSSPSTLK